MSLGSQSSSYCAECYKERLTFGSNYQNEKLKSQYFVSQSKNFSQVETKFMRLQQQIARLKIQNQNKHSTIQKLKKQLVRNQKKSSVEIQIEQNKKCLQQLKTSLLSFGNKNTQKQEYFQQTRKLRDCMDSFPVPELSLPSTQLIIGSLQKRLQQYKIQIVKLIQKVELHQKSTQWMYYFVQSYLKMVVQINKSGKFGPPLQFKQLSIRKRTKIAWKYLKDILEKVLNS